MSPSAHSGATRAGPSSSRSVSAPVPMAHSALCYRGLPYDHSHDERPSAAPIEHVYRGHHYALPLLHQPSPTDEGLDLVYRGSHYHPHHA